MSYQRPLRTLLCTLNLAQIVLGTGLNLNLTRLLSGTEWPAGTTVSFPNSQEFDESTVRWTAYTPPEYCAAISVSGPEAVAQAVSNITVRARKSVDD